MFSGTPLLLAAVLVAVGVLVQIMTLTGVRGWLVIHAMSFQSPWVYGALVGIPLLGGVLTAIGTANSLGVPFAFAFIHQDMILNISALSAICRVVGILSADGNLDRPCGLRRGRGTALADHPCGAADARCC